MTFRFWSYHYGPDGRRPTAVNPAQILPGLWYVGGYSYCCYLLATQAGPVLVDAGVEQETEQYLANLRSAGHQPAELRAVLHTHNHPDHTGATPRLVAMSGAQTMIGEEDAPELAVRAPVTRTLREGDEIVFGQTRLVFLHTPGHTRGCGMYLTEFGGYRVCFVGDACGPYIFEQVRWKGDAEAFRRSAARMKQVQADVYLPGHPHQTLEVSPDGDPRLAQEQWHRYLEGRVRRMEELVSAAGGA